MKKLLLLLLCVPLIFSCKEKKDINELKKENNNKYEYYPNAHSDAYTYGSKNFGEILNKETGKLWSIYRTGGGEIKITKIVIEKDL